MRFLDDPQPEIDDIDHRLLQIAKGFHTLREIIDKLGYRRLHPAAKRRLADRSIEYMNRLETATIGTLNLLHMLSLGLPEAPGGPLSPPPKPPFTYITTETTREILKSAGDLLLLLSLLDRQSDHLIHKIGTLVKEISSTTHKEEAR